VDLHAAMYASWFLVAILLGVTAVSLAGLRRLGRRIGELEKQDSVSQERLDEAARKLEALRSAEAALRSEAERRATAEELGKRIPALETELRGAKLRIETLMVSERELASRVAGLNAGLNSAQGQLDERTRLAQEVAFERDGLRTLLEQVRREFAEQSATMEAERTAAADREQFLRGAQEQLGDRFRTLAAQILEQQSAKFSATNQESLSALLSPLKDRLAEFDQKVTSVYDKESRERLSLQQEIRLLTELHTRMSKETESLTRALKGSGKTQGMWGELVLDTLLAGSGLREGAEYVIQQSLLDEEGHRLQPDVVVNLSHDEAYRKLTTGRGNLVKTAERVRSLGVKPSKSLATPLVELAADTDDEASDLSSTIPLCNPI
jgi:DNA anti-recombination protein RmuC